MTGSEKMTKNTKKPMKKGLGALLGVSADENGEAFDVVEDIEKSGMPPADGKNVVMLRTIDIEPNSAQPRKTFDMEKLAPSIHSTNAVFLFKNGIKGEYIVVNGEWSWHKNSFLRPLMYIAKKWFLKKIEW